MLVCFFTNGDFQAGVNRYDPHVPCDVVFLAGFAQFGRAPAVNRVVVLIRRNLSQLLTLSLEKGLHNNQRSTERMSVRLPSGKGRLYTCLIVLY
jgi:hypothetical protein